MKLLFLVLVLLLLQGYLPYPVKGIRLGKGLATLEELVRHHDHSQGKVASLTEGGKNIGSTKKKISRASNGRSSSSKDPLPSIQEDYRGPRNHKPRHHKH